ncbi:hypothetical protein PDTK01_05360 [Phycicoccus sp. DTK01]|nr:hypothetical protein PDTK01_05360 [Phycicoccus sp. DTK01]
MRSMNQPPGTRALTLVAVGLVVVFVDLSVDGFDLVADPLGWALVVVGLHRVRSLHAGFAVTRAAALTAAVLSVAEVAAATGLLGRATWPGLLVTIADLGVVAGITLALSALLRSDDPRSAHAARTILGADVMATAVGLTLFGLHSATTSPLGFVLQGGTNDAVTVLFLLVVLAGLAARVWLVVLLVQVADRLEPGPARGPEVGPASGPQSSGV